MSPVIDNDQFSNAQSAELANWKKHSSNANHIQYEIDEHSEIEKPLRLIVGGQNFYRGLEVGIGCYCLGFLSPHLTDLVRRIDGIDPLPRINIKIDDKSLESKVDAIRKRVNYIQTKAESIPTVSQIYDIVSCINVVDHAQNPGLILQEINRVLKPGGILVFGVSTLSLAGELKWKWKKKRNFNEWIYVAHPHTFQWKRADALVKTIVGEVLWNNNPSIINRCVGRGRMSFWIIRKN